MSLMLLFNTYLKKVSRLPKYKLNVLAASANDKKLLVGFLINGFWQTTIKEIVLPNVPNIVIKRLKYEKIDV